MLLSVAVAGLPSAVMGVHLADLTQCIFYLPCQILVNIENVRKRSILLAFLNYAVTSNINLCLPVLRFELLHCSARLFGESPIKDDIHRAINFVFDLIDFVLRYYFEPLFSWFVIECPDLKEDRDAVLRARRLGVAVLAVQPTPPPQEPIEPKPFVECELPTTTVPAITPAPAQESNEPEIVGYYVPTTYVPITPPSPAGKDNGDPHNDISSTSSYDMDMLGMPGSFPPSPVTSDSNSWDEDIQLQDDTASISSYEVDMPGNFPSSSILSDSSSWYEDFTPHAQVVDSPQETLEYEGPALPVTPPNPPREDKAPPKAQDDTASIDTADTRFPASIPSSPNLSTRRSKSRSHKSKPRPSADRHRPHSSPPKPKRIGGLVQRLCEPELPSLTQAHLKALRQEEKRFKAEGEWLQIHGDNKASWALYHAVSARMAADEQFEAEFAEFVASQTRPVPLYVYWNAKRQHDLRFQRSALPSPIRPISIASITKMSKFKRALRRLSVTSVKAKLSIGRRNKPSSVF